MTILTVVLGFVFKDYLIPGWIEKRTKRKGSEYLFAKYKNQLFKACMAFLNRLHEIYRTRSHYLWSQTSMSSFYEYKYKSSVYRLCVLLGWMRAFQLLESEMTITRSNDQLHRISEAIREVESRFADGQGVEMYIAKAICDIAKVDINTLDENVVIKFSVAIDDLIQKFQKNNSEKYIADLSSELQSDFIIELIALMKDLRISDRHVNERKGEIIKEVSIKVALIYRDWQQAIGDLMLIKISDQSYDVISFKSFEKFWAQGSNMEERIWISRAERIFEKLDMRVDKKNDSRIEQLRGVYKSVYVLFDKLYGINIGTKPISIDIFNKISKTID
jgi:hypothetical protein